MEIALDGPERWRGRGRPPAEIPDQYVQLAARLYSTRELARFERPVTREQETEVKAAIDWLRKAATAKGLRAHVQNDPDAIRVGVYRRGETRA